MDMMVGIIFLIIGYGLGVGSRWVVKTALKDYVTDRINDLNNVTNTYTQKIQLQCNSMIEEAQKEAMSIYKGALEKAAEVTFKFEGTDFN